MQSPSKIFASILIALLAGVCLAQNANDLQQQQRDEYARQKAAAAANPAQQKTAATQPGVLYLDTSRSYNERARDLIGRMRVEEKIAFAMCDNVAMPQYGIPAFSQYRECLHGVHPFIMYGTEMMAANPKAMEEFRSTVYPHSITMAATWDTGLMRKVADQISTEARGALNGKGSSFFAPNINIFRDPRWGRGQETFGEDPYLAGRFAVAYITGLQGSDPVHVKSFACAKHYAVHSGPEGERLFFNANVGMHDLYETYLPAFEAAVREGRVGQVMTSYNAVNGVPASLSTLLLKTILRGEWGYDGEIITDAGALNYATTQLNFGTEVENTVLALHAGLDADIGGWQAYLGTALSEKRISEVQLDEAVRRRLMLLYRLGRMDDAQLDPYGRITRSVLESPEHLATARQAAREGIVLLKNEGGLLPLSKSIKTLALIGPLADHAILGTYEGKPTTASTIAKGLTDAFGPGVSVRKVTTGNPYAPAEPAALRPLPMEWATCTTSAQPAPQRGIWGRYYDTRMPALALEIAGTVETTPAFRLYAGAALAKMLPRDFCAIWETTVTPAEDCVLYLENMHMSKVRLTLNGQVMLDTRCWNASNAISNNGGFKLTAGAAYKLRLETTSANFQLLVGKPARPDFAQAVAAARACDAVVLACGISATYENEFTDRLTTELPWDQQQLIREVCAAAGRKPVVLAVSSGSSVALPWAARNVPAIVWCGIGGGEAGAALADVLLGNFNPSGRLPITFYASDDQLPPMHDYRMTPGRTYRYFTGEPQWEFGHGLSYTTFGYTNLQVRPAAVDTAAAVTVQVMVKNTGSRAGAEVCQLYVSHPDESSVRPLRSLQGFARVELRPGEEKIVEFTLTPWQLALVDEQGKRWVKPGRVAIHVGGDQRHGLDATVLVEGKPTMPTYGFTE